LIVYVRPRPVHDSRNHLNLSIESRTGAQRMAQRGALTLGFKPFSSLFLPEART
jgi:hypothetical protein